MATAALLPLSRWPYRQSVAPPSSEPPAVDWVSTRGEAALLSIWKPAALSMVPTTSPAADSAETLTAHRVPASVRGDTLGAVRHVRVPRVLLELRTVHAARVAPPLVRISTCMRAASSPKPSPARVSTTPPAALPAATPPPEVPVATLVRESTPATLGALVGGRRAHRHAAAHVGVVVEVDGARLAAADGHSRAALGAPAAGVDARRQGTRSEAALVPCLGGAISVGLQGSAAPRLTPRLLPHHTSHATGQEAGAAQLQRGVEGGGARGHRLEEGRARDNASEGARAGAVVATRVGREGGGQDLGGADLCAGATELRCICRARLLTEVRGVVRRGSGLGLEAATRVARRVEGSAADAGTRTLLERHRPCPRDGGAGVAAELGGSEAANSHAHHGGVGGRCEVAAGQRGQVDAARHQLLDCGVGRRVGAVGRPVIAQQQRVVEHESGPVPCPQEGDGEDGSGVAIPRAVDHHPRGIGQQRRDQGLGLGRGGSPRQEGARRACRARRAARGGGGDGGEGEADATAEAGRAWAAPHHSRHDLGIAAHAEQRQRELRGT
eukprot:scaffold52211_cov48-Phaeocystis_antarctica.AAC.2